MDDPIDDPMDAMEQLLSHQWVLDGKEVRKARSMEEVVAQYMSSNRMVARDEVGDFYVSTIFLTHDHSHGFTDKPVLFETMAFNNIGTPLWCDRYATYDEAVDGHKDMVAHVKALPPGTRWGFSQMRRSDP